MSDEVGQNLHNATLAKPYSLPEIRVGLAGGLLAGIVALVYLRILGDDFVDWDDIQFIVDNPLLHPVTVAHLASFWRSAADGIYQPIHWTVLSCIALLPGAPGDEARSSLNPYAFHAVSLILHLLNTLLVFGILRSFTTTSIPAFLGSLVFALHPLQVENVAWASGMDRLSNGSLSLAAVRLFLEWRKRELLCLAFKENWHPYALAVLASILAYLAKPTAIALPLAVLFIDRWLIGRPLKSCLAAYWPWQMAMAPMLLITLAAAGAPRDGTETAAWTRPFIALDSLTFYCVKCIDPIKLAIDYGLKPGLLLSHGWGYLGWIVPALITVSAWSCRRTQPSLIGGWGIFVALLLPTLGLLPFSFETHSVVADRYVYLSMLGPAIAVACLMNRPQPRVLWAGAIAVTILLGMLSNTQTMYWQNTETLMRHAQAVNPNSFAAANNLGNTLFTQGKIADALTEYRLAEAIDPTMAQPHYNCGQIFRNAGNLPGAVAEFAQASALWPHITLADIAEGDMLLQFGRTAEAQDAYRKAILKNPANATAHFRLGNIALGQRDFKTAEDEYAHACRLAPEDGRSHVFLIHTMLLRGDRTAARAEFIRSSTLNDRSPAFHDAMADLGRQFGM